MGIFGRITSNIYIYIYEKFNIGLNCGRRSFVKRGGILGKNCVIFPDVEFGSEPYLIKIGDNVRITNGVRFVTHDGGMWVLRNLGIPDIDKFGTIEIGNNVHIGWNAIIMPNVKIGNNCVIGAGAVVTKNIPDNSVAIGVPARVIEDIEVYKEKALKSADYTKSMSPEQKKEYIQKKYSFYTQSDNMRRIDK